MNSYWPGPLPEPSVRTLDDMRCVLADPDQSGSMPLYYMYRDLALTAGDRTYLREQNLGSRSPSFFRGVRQDQRALPPAQPLGHRLPRVLLPGARRGGALPPPAERPRRYRRRESGGVRPHPARLRPSTLVRRCPPVQRPWPAGPPALTDHLKCLLTIK